jgi:hypothetical protein
VSAGSTAGKLRKNLEDTKVYNTRLTFWSYLAIRVFIRIIGGAVFAMFEGAVMSILRVQKAAVCNWSTPVSVE